MRFAEGAGDEMCYFIKTEGEKELQYLTSKNIGTDKEHANEESKHQPELEELKLGFLNSTNHPVEESIEESLSPLENIDSGETETSDNPPDGTGNGLDNSGSGGLETGEPETGEVLVEANDDCTDAELDLDKNLPPGIQSDPNEGVDNLYNEHDIQEEDYELDVIIYCHFKNKVLMLKAGYYNESSDVKDVWESPSNTIKKEAHLKVANAEFRMKVARRSGREQPMAKKNKQKLSRNARNLNFVREKYGNKFPNDTKVALLLDKSNGNKKWAEAILKETGMLDQLNAFKYHSPSTEFKKEEGRQLAPMHMIFNIKHDL
eukprot:448546-Ditylum_brightwellii.AAC.2